MSEKRTRWNYGFGSIYIRRTKLGNDRLLAAVKRIPKRAEVESGGNSL
jgi:hypothetical protein